MTDQLEAVAIARAMLLALRHGPYESWPVECRELLLEARRLAELVDEQWRDKRPNAVGKGGAE